MANVGILEAKTKFSGLVDRAEKGEEITITRHGRPVAKLVRIGAVDREEARTAFEELLEMRKGTTLGGLDWKELRDEGRK